MADKQAISQLSQISKNTTKNIGLLRRKKEQLEFRIATEAFSVEAEKDLIRKRNEIDRELEDALKSFRLRKKLEFIDKDIEQLGKQLTELDARIKESDKALDVLYNEFRAITGAGERRQRNERDHNNRDRKQQREQPKPQEVSLADIAIIKDKKSDKQDKEEFDDSVLN